MIVEAQRPCNIVPIYRLQALPLYIHIYTPNATDNEAFVVMSVLEKE